MLSMGVRFDPMRIRPLRFEEALARISDLGTAEPTSILRCSDRLLRGPVAHFRPIRQAVVSLSAHFTGMTFPPKPETRRISGRRVSRCRLRHPQARLAMMRPISKCHWNGVLTTAKDAVLASFISISEGLSAHGEQRLSSEVPLQFGDQHSSWAYVCFDSDEKFSCPGSRHRVSDEKPRWSTTCKES